MVSLGPHTRGIRQYQASEKLAVTGALDADNLRQTGVGPESIGGSFKGAGQEVGQGGQELGHEMKQGKPIAAGKSSALEWVAQPRKSRAASRRP